MDNKVQYHCYLCGKEYLEHSREYVSEYPMASVDDRDAKWWHHYQSYCSEFEEKEL